MANKSLSARIKRRNAQGFKGEGSHKDFTNGGGNYLDLKQNHKDKDIIENNIRRSKLGKPSTNDIKLDAKGNIIGIVSKMKNRQYCKKYADKHQRLI